jgi:hypothetical protein
MALPENPTPLGLAVIAASNACSWLLGFDATAAAAAITVVGGAAVGLAVIAYDRVGRARLAYLREAQALAQGDLRPRLEEANARLAQLAEQNAHLADLVIALDEAARRRRCPLAGPDQDPPCLSAS